MLLACTPVALTLAELSPPSLQVYDAHTEDLQALGMHCGHAFCRKCCMQLVQRAWSQSNTTVPTAPELRCPACRAAIANPTLSMLYRNYPIESVAHVVRQWKSLPALATAAQHGSSSGSDVDADDRGVGNSTSTGASSNGSGSGAASTPAPVPDLNTIGAIFPSTRRALARSAGVAPEAVEAAVVDIVVSAGRPLPLTRIAQLLEEREAWPPAGLVGLMRQRDADHGRQPGATPVLEMHLMRPSPSMLKSFMLSRGNQTIHCEMSQTSLAAECLCAGGLKCRLGIRGSGVSSPLPSSSPQHQRLTSRNSTTISLGSATGGRAGQPAPTLYNAAPQHVVLGSQGTVHQQRASGTRSQAGSGGHGRSQAAAEDYYHYYDQEEVDDYAEDDDDYGHFYDRRSGGGRNWKYR